MRVASQFAGAELPESDSLVKETVCELANQVVNPLAPHRGDRGGPLPGRGMAAHWLEHRLAPWRDQALAARCPHRRPPGWLRRGPGSPSSCARRADEELSAREVKWVDFSPGYRAFKAARAALPRGRTR